MAQEWLSVAVGAGPAGWSAMTHINEGAVTPQAFVERFQKDPADPVVTPHGARLKNPPPPKDLNAQGVDAQDNLARLWNEGEGAERRDDAQASDHWAVWMPNTHREWAFQIPVEALPLSARSGKWEVYAVARIEAKSGVDPASLAFTAGVYDAGTQRSAGEIAIRFGDAGAEYKSYRIGTVEMNKDQYLWIAPEVNSSLTAVWVDRFYLLPAR
jgi:hypothetical protein